MNLGIDYVSLGWLFLEGTIITSLILFLFWLRNKFGLGMLYACLGLIQFLQVFISSTLFVHIWSDVYVSPGSTILFTASLFAILIIYIKEDTQEIRKIIYALIVVNVIMALLFQLFAFSLRNANIQNLYNVSIELFANNSINVIVGTTILFLDSILIIIIYELISRFTKYLFIRISVTMLIVVITDIMLFSTITFWNNENLHEIVKAGILSKSIFAIFYSFIFYIYLTYIETDKLSNNQFTLSDIYHTLSYKQKYERAAHEVHVQELKYRTLTNIAPVGIFHTKPDGTATYLNPKMEEISGLELNHAREENWLKVIHPNDQKNIIRKWESALINNQMMMEEFRFIKPDGETNWVLGIAVPEFANNKLSGFIGTITDITNIKEMQHQEIELRKKADESNRLKSAFLANMSHEIRTPMNGILGFADLLKSPNLSDAEQEEFVNIIEKSGNRMLKIINSIINISKIESGSESIKNEEVNVIGILNDNFVFLKPLALEKGLKFTFEHNVSNNNLLIETDREKFMSIITNLLSNAIKYTDKGYVKLSCTEDISSIKISIKDSGIGISEENLSRVFEQFMQEDIEDRMARQGAGLGLSIAKAYSEMIGAQIFAESQKLQGSTFHLVIPKGSKM